MSPICSLHPLPYRPDPAGYFERIRRAPGAVLLDSGRPVAERGRFDILSAWPVATSEPGDEESGTEFFNRLRAGLRAFGRAELPDGVELPFAGGLIGYLSYDFGRRLNGTGGKSDKAEKAEKAESAEKSEKSEKAGKAYDADVVGGTDGARGFPIAGLGLYDWAVITDHQRQTTQLMFHPRCSAGRRAELISRFEAVSTGDHAVFNAGREFGQQNSSNSKGPQPDFHLLHDFASCIDRDTYRDAIERIHEYIRAGDCYQVNYTQCFQAPYRGDPWSAYRALREACPTPYAGYINLGGDDAVLSLSPERFLRLQQRQIEARPIKGTRPRGATPEHDEREAEALRTSEKDRAENVMIVDLLRNDIGRSSRIGSVRVPELCSLESYPNVHHLVSSVRADLADGLDAFDLLAGSFPGGSITGAPKIRAMEIIDELEPHRRSLYCGSLMYIDVRGDMDSSITIRSLLALDGRIRCWGGGGIVMDSEWEAEYQESLDKVDILLRTLEGRAKS